MSTPEAASGLAGQAAVRRNDDDDAASTNILSRCRRGQCSLDGTATVRNVYMH